MLNYALVIFMNKQLKGSLLLLIATIIWGSAFLSQDIAMEYMGPFTFQAVRCFLAVCALVPVIFMVDYIRGKGRDFFRRWADAKLWKAGILCGIPLFLACNLQQMGLVDVATDPGKSGFLTAMYIVIVPVIGIFLKKKPTTLLPISVSLAVVGLYFISFAGVAKISTGDLLTIGCAFAFAIQIIFVDKFAPSLDALRLNTIQGLVCGVLSACVMAFTEKPTWSGIVVCVPYLAHVGILSMGVAYALQIIGQKNVEPSTASLIMSLESVFALIFGMLILHEPMTPWKAIGCTLMFLAIILSQISVKQTKSKQKTAA